MGWRPQPLRAADDKTTRAAEITLRQSIYPFCLVTILFFLWGFAYGLLDVLNKHFQEALNITRARSAGLQAAYFGAYPVAALTFAGWTLRHFGYRATFMLGLILYGIGALMFWPSAVYRSFGGFCGATFIIGSGLGSLETASNPYISVIGPPKYSDVRLNLAQSVQAIGTVVGPVLASYAFFKDTDIHSLANVQWTYLGISAFVFCLAAVFYVSHIPEVTDADMQLQADETGVEETKPLHKQYLLFAAMIAQFTYVGSQVAIAGYFVNYSVEVAGTSSAQGSIFYAVAQGLFAIGRFSGSFFMTFIKPRRVFLAYFICVIVFISAATGARGKAGLATLMLTLFFESILFPTIFTMGLRGLGRHSKRGGSWIVATISGGACIPVILGSTADHFNDTGRAMFVPLIFFVVSINFAFIVNFHRPTRDMIDSFRKSKVGVAAAEEGSVPPSPDLKEKEDENSEVKETL